jgi:hypothetical protein
MVPLLMRLRRGETVPAPPKIFRHRLRVCLSVGDHLRRPRTLSALRPIPPPGCRRAAAVAQIITIEAHRLSARRVLRESLLDCTARCAP